MHWLGSIILFRYLVLIYFTAISVEVLVLNRILDITIFVMSRNAGHMYCLRHHLCMFIIILCFVSSWAN